MQLPNYSAAAPKDFGSRFRAALPDILMGIGTSLATNNWANAGKFAAESRQRREQEANDEQGRNVTMEWLKARQAEELIPLVASKQITPMQAIQMASQTANKPSAVEEYEYAREQGFNGSFMDFTAAKRQQTNVNVNNKTEGEYDKTLAKAQAERFMALQTDAQKAQGALTAFDAMEGLMSQPGFYSGAFGDQVANAKRLGASMGFDAEGIEGMETFNALSKQAALDVMGGSLGTGFSNADRDFVTDQVPKLGNTPEGNKRLIGVQRKLAKRKQEIAQLAREYASQNGGRLDYGFDDFLRKWAEQNPVFGPEDFGSNDDGLMDPVTQGLLQKYGG